MDNIPNSPQNSKTENELSLRELFLKIRLWIKWLTSKFLIICMFTLLGGLVGSLYSYLDKTKFTATSTFVLEEGDKGGGLGQFAGLASIAGIDLANEGVGIFQGDNIIELYKSRTMIQQALLTPLSNDDNKLNIQVYIELNDISEKLDKSNPGILNFNFAGAKQLSRAQDSLIGEIVRDINKNYLVVSKPDKKLSIIKVDVIAKSEVFAKSFNDAIVKTVNDFYIQTKTRKSLQNLAILQHQTDSVKKVLSGNLYSGIAAIDATANLNPTRQVLRVTSQKSQFNAEANKAILIQLVQNLELSKIALRKETPLIQTIDEPKFPLFKKKTGLVKGFILGAFLFGVFTIVFLLLRKILNDIIRG